MPSSLATVLSLTSGFSPCPPVSVLVRAAMESSLETFLGSWHHVLQYLSKDVPLPLTSYIPLTHFTVSLLYALTTIRSVAHTSLLRHSFISIAGTGISACFPSTTPFGLALGPDLPRADEPSPGILGLSVCRILTYISLLTPAFSLPCSPPLLTVRLLRACNAPLPLNSEVESAASVVCLAPVHFWRRVTRLVSCYALFEGWLLLSQPPSCLCIPTSFST